MKHLPSSMIYHSYLLGILADFIFLVVGWVYVVSIYLSIYFASTSTHIIIMSFIIPPMNGPLQTRQTALIIMRPRLRKALPDELASSSWVELVFIPAAAAVLLHSDGSGRSFYFIYFLIYFLSWNSTPAEEISSNWKGNRIYTRLHGIIALIEKTRSQTNSCGRVSTTWL